MAHILKERLYDFPRREGYLSEWEWKSLEEHASLAGLLASRDFAGSAAYVRDVHWSFAVQERFIMAYYFARENASGDDDDPSQEALPRSVWSSTCGVTLSTTARASGRPFF
ncbi:MAG: hypothetical protein MZU95_10250 [Desulfomicrobium escambiense]|nr:hypothetical protein [Desulfomicrobium escambiense]